MSNSDSFNTPVLFIVFSRPDTTQKVLKVLQVLQPARLYVSADGYRASVNNDMHNCNAVKKLIEDMINWPCDLKTNYPNYNLGPGKGPATAYDWFFSHEDEGIILEDDCLPELSFFPFCQQLLEYYRNNEKVFSINGNNFGYKADGKYSYGFTHFMSAWGWATWKRSYLLIDYKLLQWDGVKVKHLLLHRRLNRWHDIDLGWLKYWNQIYQRVKHNTWSYWDYQWMLAQVYHGQYSIFPSVNLVSNIGFSSDGTNLHDANDPMANIGTRSMDRTLIHPDSIKIDRVYERDFIKRIWSHQRSRRGIYFYTKMRLSELLRKWKLLK